MPQSCEETANESGLCWWVADRQLEEALVHSPDPLHFTEVFTLDEKTAIRHANSARALLERPLENDSDFTTNLRKYPLTIRTSGLQVPTCLQFPELGGLRGRAGIDQRAWAATDGVCGPR